MSWTKAILTSGISAHATFRPLLLTNNTAKFRRSGSCSQLETSLKAGSWRTEFCKERIEAA
jgi:hypothetical protein